MNQCRILRRGPLPLKGEGRRRIRVGLAWSEALCHAERVSASTRHSHRLVQTATWTLKRVQRGSLEFILQRYTVGPGFRRESDVKLIDAGLHPSRDAPQRAAALSGSIRCNLLVLFVEQILRPKINAPLPTGTKNADPAIDQPKALLNFFEIEIRTGVDRRLITEIEIAGRSKSVRQAIGTMPYRGMYPLSPSDCSNIWYQHRWPLPSR
jgi:hypothetical protein